MPNQIQFSYQKVGVEIVSESGDKCKALCPFPDHHESAPSFVIYADGSFYCFGCNRYGTFDDICELFNIDSSFSIGKIDVMSISNTLDKFFTAYRRRIENRIQRKYKKSSQKKLFKMYDTLDQTLLFSDFSKFESKLQIVMYIKQTLDSVLGADKVETA